MEREITGHLYKADYLHPPEYFCPNLRSVTLVLGSPVSDLGKGWVTAAIASMKDDSLVIKIDPMLKSDGFPDGLGVERNGEVVTDDFETYEALGLQTSPKQNIVLGKFLADFYGRPTPLLRPGEPKKMTTADVSHALAIEMLQQIKQSQAKHVVIEVGGIPTDLEHQILPGVFRFMSLQTLISPKIVLLSTFDYTEAKVPRIKTQLVRQAVRDVREYYGFDFEAVLVRRRRLPIQDQSEIEDELTTTAYEVQVSRDKFLFVENVQTPVDLVDILKESSLFDQPQDPLIVSSCAMGIPCKHDAEPSSLSNTVKSVFVNNPRVETFCPEVAAGLPTPRKSVEIIGGDGEDVLDGKARVETRDGEDVTQFFVAGAIALLRLCLDKGVKTAYLNPKSPSCGVGVIFDGSFSGTLTEGDGVTTALLRRWGINCVPTREIEFNRE